MLFDDLERGHAAISSGMLFYEVKLHYRHLNKFWWLRGIGTFSWSEGLPKNSQSILSCPYNYIYLICIYTYICLFQICMCDIYIYILHIYMHYLDYFRVSYNKHNSYFWRLLAIWFGKFSWKVLISWKMRNARRSGCGVAQWNRYRSGRWGVGETKALLDNIRTTTRLQSQSESQNMSRI